MLHPQKQNQAKILNSSAAIQIMITAQANSCLVQLFTIMHQEVTRLFFPTMAGCQTRENLPRIQYRLIDSSDAISTIQPLFVQPFISRVNPEPASFGTARSQGYIRPQ
jgi:hypothetical protein